MDQFPRGPRRESAWEQSPVQPGWTASNVSVAHVETGAVKLGQVSEAPDRLASGASYP